MITNRLKVLSPYIPGEQPQDKKYIKLNTNENPYSPAPAIADMLKNINIADLRLYPDPVCSKLRDSIADFYGVEPAQIFCGNGSDEVLSFVFYAFFDSQKGPLLFPNITYSFYPVYSNFYGIKYETVSLSDEFVLNVEDFLNKDCCGLIFANPNAPTGRSISLADIRRLMNEFPTDKVVVIDEAYVDFGCESAVKLINDYSNLLVVKTFSKSRSLAGMRIGYAFGNPELIKALNIAKDSFNSYPLDTLAQKMGILSMQDADYYQQTTSKVVKTRDCFNQKLISLGWNVIPSTANFVFASHPEISGSEVYKILRDHGILVRHFNKPLISDYLRITIGTDSDMENLIQVCSDYLS